tara:strand:+ start:17 stop:337 length:321 start_codon:yes stop_codon:yes gene_type:complete
MAVSLGRDGGSPTGGNGATGVINVTWNQEVTAVDVSHRGLVNASGISYKAATGGFVTRTAEIECLDATAVMTSLASAGSGYIVTNVSENRPLDGPVTFTLTAKKTS